MSKHVFFHKLVFVQAVSHSSSPPFVHISRLTLERIMLPVTLEWSFEEVRVSLCKKFQWSNNFKDNWVRPRTDI